VAAALHERLRPLLRTWSVLYQCSTGVNAASAIGKDAEIVANANNIIAGVAQPGKL